MTGLSYPCALVAYGESGCHQHKEIPEDLEVSAVYTPTGVHGKHQIQLVWATWECMGTSCDVFIYVTTVYNNIPPVSKMWNVVSVKRPFS